MLHKFMRTALQINTTIPEASKTSIGIRVRYLHTYKGNKKKNIYGEKGSQSSH